MNREDWQEAGCIVAMVLIVIVAMSIIVAFAREL